MKILFSNFLWVFLVSACASTPLFELEPVQLVPKNIFTENFTFCSEVSDDDAMQKCEVWRKEARGDLGPRLNSSICMITKADYAAKNGCKHLVSGRISYMTSLK